MAAERVDVMIIPLLDMLSCEVVPMADSEWIEFGEDGVVTMSGSMMSRLGLYYVDPALRGIANILGHVRIDRLGDGSLRLGRASHGDEGAIELRYPDLVTPDGTPVFLPRGGIMETIQHREPVLPEGRFSISDDGVLSELA